MSAQRKQGGHDGRSVIQTKSNQGFNYKAARLAGPGRPSVAGAARRFAVSSSSKVTSERFDYRTRPRTRRRPIADKLAIRLDIFTWVRAFFALDSARVSRERGDNERRASERRGNPGVFRKVSRVQRNQSVHAIWFDTGEKNIGKKKKNQLFGRYQKVTYLLENLNSFI